MKRLLIFLCCLFFFSFTHPECAQCTHCRQETKNPNSKNLVARTIDNTIESTVLLTKKIIFWLKKNARYAGARGVKFLQLCGKYIGSKIDDANTWAEETITKNNE